MAFSFIDLTLVILVGVFILFGLYFGLIHTLGSLIGALAAVVGAGYALGYVVDWLNGFMSVGPVFTVVIFFILFMIISRLIGLLFWVFENSVGLIARLPFISSLNHLLGAFMGFFEGMVVASVLLHATLTYLPAGSFVTALSSSVVGGWISGWTGFLIAWLPF